MKNSRCLNILALLLFASGVEAQVKPFGVGPITAAPGEKQSGMIEVPEGVDPGTPEHVDHPIDIDPYEVLTSPATGLLYPKVDRGQVVVKGTLLAVVTDFFGKTLAEVRAPFAGVVLYVVATPPITRGEPVAMVGTPK